MKDTRLLRAIGGVDDDLIERALQRNTVRRKSKALWLKWAVPAAACFVIAAIALPMMMNNPTLDDPILNNPGVISSNTPQNNDSNVVVTDPSSDADTIIPGLRDEECPLTLNVAGSLMQSSRLWPEGFFYYPLTEEQINAVFPSLNLTLAATAFYRPDGTLLSVTATETQVPGRADAPITVNGHLNRTEIQLGEGEIIEDCVMLPDDTPIISDVFGVSVTAYMMERDDDTVYFQAEFMLNSIAYRVKLYDEKTAGQLRLTAIVNDIIYYGSADLSVLKNPVVPELRNERLTLEQAYNDPDFGAYLPEIIPSRFGFELAHRFINQETNSLYVMWTVGLDEISWGVSSVTDYYRERIVSPYEREKYDMSLYPIPWAQSVPEELREYVHNPVFLAEELTLEIIQARAYYVDNDRGDTPGWRMDFNVLYDEIVVNINAKGLTPEQVWEMFAELRN